MLEPIHKFNNSNFATLCNKCSKIISIFLTDDLFCSKYCEAKYRAKTLMALKVNWKIEEYHEQIEKEVHYNRSNLNK